METDKTARGWWWLGFGGVYELTDDDRQHIAALILEGFTSGEVIHEVVEDE